MDLDDSFFKSIKGDARMVLETEPRPTMYWPHLAEENYMEKYYVRCVNRILSRLPWLAIKDIDMEQLLGDGSMMMFLIDQTPKCFFREEDLAAWKEQVGMTAMERRLSGAKYE